MGKRIYVSTQYEQGRGELVIEDAGIGLTTDYLTGWPISSAPQVGTAREKGVGLGLEICQELIRLNQGELHITSRPGEGTKVVILL